MSRKYDNPSWDGGERRAAAVPETLLPRRPRLGKTEVCACGCGENFDRAYPEQRFVDTAHWRRGAAASPPPAKLAIIPTPNRGMTVYPGTRRPKKGTNE